MAASIETKMVDVITKDFHRAFGIGSRDWETDVQRGSRNHFVDYLVLLELGLGDTMAFDINPEGSNWRGSPFAVDHIPVGRGTQGEVASRTLEIICLVSSLGIKGISLQGPNKRE